MSLSDLLVTELGLFVLLCYEQCYYCVLFIMFIHHNMVALMK